jgi:hypothetical protein
VAHLISAECPQAPFVFAVSVSLAWSSLLAFPGTDGIPSLYLSSSTDLSSKFQLDLLGDLPVSSLAPGQVSILSRRAQLPLRLLLAMLWLPSLSSKVLIFCVDFCVDYYREMLI